MSQEVREPSFGWFNCDTDLVEAPTQLFLQLLRTFLYWSSEPCMKAVGDCHKIPVLPDRKRTPHVDSVSLLVVASSTGLPDLAGGRCLPASRKWGSSISRFSRRPFTEVPPILSWPNPFSPKGGQRSWESCGVAVAVRHRLIYQNVACEMPIGNAIDLGIRCSRGHAENGIGRPHLRSPHCHELCDKPWCELDS